MGLRTRLAAPADLAEITDIAVAAFHPDTDAITRHLFPPHPYLPDVVVEESVRAWREMRMAMKLRARDTTVVVAVDDAVGGKVVGFSMWDRPVKGDKAPDSVTTNTPCPALDNDALAEVYHVLDGDIHKHFGVQGLNDMFCEFSSQLTTGKDRLHSETSTTSPSSPRSSVEELASYFSIGE